MGCSAALRVRYCHWEYKDSLGKSGPGQSLTQVKFIKRWKDLAEYSSWAARSAFSRCRNLGTDSVLPLYDQLLAPRLEKQSHAAPAGLVKQV